MPDGIGDLALHVTAFPVVAVELSALITDDTGPSQWLPPRHPCRGDPDVA